MRLIDAILLFFSGCALLAAFSCSSPVVIGGGGTEWEAKVIGLVRDSSGGPLANARVLLLPSMYNPVSEPAIPDSLTDTTDNSGHYSIAVTDTGIYSIEVAGIDKGYRSLVPGVKVSRDDTVLVHNAVARLPGTINVTLPSNVDSTNGYFYIPGTTMYALLSNVSGTVLLDSVPAGVSVSIYYAVRGSSAMPQPVRDSIIVAPGGTMNVEYVGWNFSKKLVLNTTASGANIAGDVLNFPVLVRLTDSSFNFAETKSAGEDVRFTKSDGTPLPYEIETWDPAGGSAAIWVRVDTVFGNNGTQSITMFWGNSSATGQSNAAAVFDTASGFRGVWHLADRTALAVDATVNNYSGTYTGNLPNWKPGAIGDAQSLDGSGDYADMGSVLDMGSNNFTVSAWIRRGNASTVQAIAGKSNGGVPTAAYGYSFAFYPADTLNIAVATGGTVFGDSGSFRVKSSIALTDTASWHHVAAVIDRSKSANCRLFIDGIDRSGIVEGDISTVGALLNTLPFRLGEAANGDFPFAGSMDEVEITFAARSADWIKLCYMNQKENDALVILK
jgi:hypothetical protein